MAKRKWRQSTTTNQDYLQKKSSCKYFEKTTIHVSVSIYKYAWC